MEGIDHIAAAIAGQLADQRLVSGLDGLVTDHLPAVLFRVGARSDRAEAATGISLLLKDERDGVFALGACVNGEGEGAGVVGGDVLLVTAVNDALHHCLGHRYAGNDQLLAGQHGGQSAVEADRKQILLVGDGFKDAFLHDGGAVFDRIGHQPYALTGENHVDLELAVLADGRFKLLHIAGRHAHDHADDAQAGCAGSLDGEFTGIGLPRRTGGEDELGNAGSGPREDLQEFPAAHHIIQRLLVGIFEAAPENLIVQVDGVAVADGLAGIAAPGFAAHRTGVFQLQETAGVLHVLPLGCGIVVALCTVEAVLVGGMSQTEGLALVL